FLKAHLVFMTGDTPGISKLLHFNGHTAKVPCRAYKLTGMPYKFSYRYTHKDGSEHEGEKTQYYYALYPPTTFSATFSQEAQSAYICSAFRTTIDNLPLHFHDKYIKDGWVSMGDDRCALESGAKAVSPLVYLDTITILELSPFDIM